MTLYRLIGLKSYALAGHLILEIRTIKVKLMLLSKKTFVKKLKYNRGYLNFNYMSVGLKEAWIETIWAKEFQGGHLIEFCFDFLLGKPFGKILIHFWSHFAFHILNTF